MRILAAVFFITSTISGQNLNLQQQNALDKMVNHDLRMYGDEYINNKKYYLSSDGSSFNSITPIKFTTVTEKNDTETAVYYNKEKKYSLIGKWTHFSLHEYNLKYYVSHCPAFYNEDGIIIEYSVYDSKAKKKSSYEILAENRISFEKYYFKESNSFKLVKYDTINNYVFYKKKELNITTNEVQDVYYLLGAKNKKIFRIALFNFKEEDYVDIDKFLVDCYVRNR